MIAAPHPAGPAHLTTLGEARALFATIADARVEIALIAYLADDQRVIALDRIVGTLDSVEIPPRRIVATALLHAATGVLIAHNHPSGDPHPSAADLAFARRLAQVLRPLDLRLVDQLVLAGPATTSLRAMGLL
jgi:DNA repair protein RadC